MSITLTSQRVGLSVQQVWGTVLPALEKPTLADPRVVELSRRLRIVDACAVRLFDDAFYISPEQQEIFYGEVVRSQPTKLLSASLPAWRAFELGRPELTNGRVEALSGMLREAVEPVPFIVAAAGAWCCVIEIDNPTMEAVRRMVDAVDRIGCIAIAEEHWCKTEDYDEVRALQSMVRTGVIFIAY